MNTLARRIATLVAALAHLANATTIALVPATRKHGGGDEASRTVNRPRELGHL